MNRNIRVVFFKLNYSFRNFSTATNPDVQIKYERFLPSSSKRKLLYKNLFHCRSEIEFAKYLASNVVYNANGLVAISKPWGFPIHQSSRMSSSHQNSAYIEQHLNSMIFGKPKFCVANVLDLLAQLLNTSPLYIVKSLNKNWSGLLLLSTSNEIKNPINKSIRRAKSDLIPYMRFYCIVNGMIPNAKLGESFKERCGICLTEIDELGKFKEPIYVPPSDMSNNMRKRGSHRLNKMILGPVKPVTIEYRVLATNPKLAISLIDLHTTATKWSLIQCFLAYKTSFVLGDTFFSYRVKHIFGQPITMASLKQKRLENWHHLDSNFEPLSQQVCQALGVKSNREIPLMIHHHGIVFPSLLRYLPKEIKTNNDGYYMNGNDQKEKTKDHLNKNDLIIEANRLEQLPNHFVQTLDCLDLNVFHSI